VNRAVQSTTASDRYFRELIKPFNLSFAYLVRSLPRQLKHSYGGASQLAIYARLEKGVVLELGVSGEFSIDSVDLLVTSDYGLAKQLFLGEASPAASYVSRKLKVRPVNGFLQWPRFAAKSPVAARMVLNVAREVPTVFSRSDIACQSLPQ
jgi:hypothetical protein